MPGPRPYQRLGPCPTLLLTALILAGSAGIASASPPTFLTTFTSPGLCSPRGVALTSDDEVIVGSDCHLLHHMERFTNTGVLLGTWGFPMGFQGPPNGVATDGADHVFVTAMDQKSVYKFTKTGALVSTFSSPGSPVDVAVDGNGDVFVVELDSNQLRKHSNGGVFLTSIGSIGTGPGQFQNPVGIGLDASGRIYVADPGRGRVLRFLANGSFDMEFAPPIGPTDVAVGPDGNVYVIAFGDIHLHQYSPAGVLLSSSVSPYGLVWAHRIAISPSGAIFITEQYYNRVSIFQIDRATGAKHTTFSRLKALYR